MKRRNLILSMYAGLMMFSSTSCFDSKDVYNPERVNAEIEASFDFCTTVSCPIEISVGYKTLVTIYGDNPETTSNPRKLYAAYTDKSGQYNGNIVIPSEYIGKKLYAKAFDFCIETVAGHSNIQFVKTQSRSISPSNGETTAAMCKRLRDHYMTYLPESDKRNAEKIKKDEKINIKITENDTELTAAFIYSGASVGSKLYYYYYKSDQDPQELFNQNHNGWEEIYNKFGKDEYHIFKDIKDRGEIWNAWKDENSSYYAVGATDDLLFYGENYNESGTTKFPAGYTISFFIKMVNEGANNRPLYSESWLNSREAEGAWHHNQQQVGQFKDTESESIIFGFEDLALKLYDGGKYTCDYDYNDIIFAINTQFSNINEDDITPLPTPEPIKEATEGTLLYEDLYPSQGDYDMNDVIIEYTWTKYFDDSNKLMKIDYEFTPIHDGAAYLNDFSLMIDDCISTPIEIFKNHKEALGKTFTGSITNGIAGKQKDEVSWEDFNPFIIIEKNNYEVHLTKKRASANANQEGLDEFQRNYVSYNKTGEPGEYPFAMNIAKKGFIPVTESARIETNYPDYTRWVESEGKEHTDWYSNYIK